MKATAQAPANIAFIKYWGNRNDALRIPNHNTLSMNLDGIFTTTSVEFSPKFSADMLFLEGKRASDKEVARVSKVLDVVRKLAKTSEHARVESSSNFPASTGIASSASAFAALAVAGSVAAGLALSEKNLSRLARLGSGSACRSIPSGFVEWRGGDKDKNSYSVSLYSPQYWQIADLIVIVDTSAKKVGSTEGHALAKTSPLYQARLAGMQKKLRLTKKALQKKNFAAFGEIVEAEAINMHAIMLTSTPSLLYLNGTSIEILKAISEWREEGLEAYVTFDAGPNPHILCEEKNVKKLQKKLLHFPGVKNILVARPGKGAQLISE